MTTFSRSHALLHCGQTASRNKVAKWVFQTTDFMVTVWVVIFRLIDSTSCPEGKIITLCMHILFEKDMGYWAVFANSFYCFPQIFAQIVEVLGKRSQHTLSPLTIPLSLKVQCDWTSRIQQVRNHNGRTTVHLSPCAKVAGSKSLCPSKSMRGHTGALKPLCHQNT